MAVSTADPMTALIVIDLQKGIVAYPTVHPVGEVVGQASAPADALRRNTSPVTQAVASGLNPLLSGVLPARGFGGLREGHSSEDLRALQ